MTSLADLPELIGFFSYSRDDDQDSNNALSTIRALIQNELRARLGRSRQSLRLWQDQEAVAPGSMWESQINAAVQQSVFFIPIITPRVINSKYCGIEFKRFLDRERELGRDDLVFPILYIDVDELQDENQWRGHPLLEVIGQRQYVDWREYRYELDSPTLRRAAANLCAKIAASLRRPQPDERAEAADREAAAQREADRVAREHAEKERRRNEDAERARLEGERRDRAKAEVPPLKQEVDPPDAEKSQPERQQEVRHKGANSPLSEPLRAAIVWGIAGAITGVLSWATMTNSAEVVRIYLIGIFLLGLVAAIMLYRNALSLRRAAGAGAALIISQFAIYSFFGFHSLNGSSGFYLINGLTYLVPAVIDPRLRTRSLLLKVLAVSVAGGIVSMAMYGSLHGEYLLSFTFQSMAVSLMRGIIFGLFGYEIAQHRLR
jgi:hypothetical protein